MNVVQKNVQRLSVPSFAHLVVGLALLTGAVIALFCLTHTVFAAEGAAATPRFNQVAENHPVNPMAPNTKAKTVMFSVSGAETMSDAEYDRFIQNKIDTVVVPREQKEGCSCSTIPGTRDAVLLENGQRIPIKVPAKVGVHVLCVTPIRS